jgi:HAD superfamily hydrolase (TIGR01509 family)
MTATNDDYAYRAPALLFDLDGTLVDSVYEHVTSWHTALSRAGIELAKWKLHRRIGMSGRDFLPELLRELGHRADPAQIDRMSKAKSRLFLKSLPMIRALPGVDTLFRFLRRNQIAWAVATSGDKQQVGKLLAKLETRRGFPITTADDIEDAKPAPDSFVLAAKKLGVHPSTTTVIGDSPWDLLAAQRMKAIGVGVLTGGYSRSELERAGAYRVYDDAEDLLAHVEDLGIGRRR